MIAYAESSAVLAWLLGEPEAASVRVALSAASRIVTSQLTLLEAERCLIRGVETRQASQGDADAAARLLAGTASRWTLLGLTAEVLEAARRRFPREPLRTLDALHLASAGVFRSALGDIAVVSLDARVRENAGLLGFALVP